jgi:hypothetical protein
VTGWRTSSSCEGGACVEVADGGLVRDSADPDGPVLAFGAASWQAFTTALTGSEESDG